MARKGAFFAAFFVIMLISYGFLVIIDFVPEPIEGETSEQEAEETDESSDEAQGGEEEMPVIEREPVAPLPISITIDDLDRTVTVLNPASDSLAEMDAALTKGVIRHPASADFNDEGNILILGHSSYLPTVFNKNYQAFNGLENLAWGDIIRLHSEDAEYIYRVERVYEAKASELVVPNTRGAARLTLATCDVLGAKEDRFIVEAVLIDTKELARS